MNGHMMNRMNTQSSRTGDTHPTPPTPPTPSTPPVPGSPHAEVLLDVEALVHGWQALLVNRARPYALQQEDGTYRWVFQPLDTRVLRAHLAGSHTVALSSLDERGCCRWVCLDADAPDGLDTLQSVRTALADLGLPALLEASRRGGHLWLLFAEPLPALLPRALVGAVLDGLVTRRALDRLPELYPDTDGAEPVHLGQVGYLGHAVRLPLGVHRRTGRRYPLLGERGEPLPLTTPRDLAAQMAYLLAHPRLSAEQLRVAARRLGVPPDTSGKQRGERDDRRMVRRTWSPSGDGAPSGPTTPAGSTTTSAVIRWVDAHVSPLDLLDDLCPQTEMRVAGQGFVGWCPLHDDRAPDERGEPGSPSFYVVHNQRYGWSWRCLSSNCAYSQGPMKHSFRLFQELLGLDVRAAIGAAYARWSSELGSLEPAGGVDEDGEHREDGGSDE